MYIFIEMPNYVFVLFAEEKATHKYLCETNLPVGATQVFILNLFFWFLNK